MQAINPRQSPSEVIAQLRGCSRIMPSRCIGAICADAMVIPWAPCILAHRFNEFKWNDWLATVHARWSRWWPTARWCAIGIQGLVQPAGAWCTTRPIPAIQRCARSRLPHTDARRVSDALAAYARVDAHFACSAPSTHIAQQRQRMLDACARFAQDYGLRFTP